MASTAIQREINARSGQRRNMNGAGVGGRLVTKRTKDERGRISTVPGKSQLGNRDQRYRDIRSALGLSTG